MGPAVKLPSDISFITWRLTIPLLRQCEHPERFRQCDPRALQRNLRVRQHVNPFKPALQEKGDPVDWGSIYKDPLKPLIVDIGCATGRWLLLLARDSKLDANYLGLDIRKPVRSCMSCCALHGLQCWAV